jgi:hypothetical protein
MKEEGEISKAVHEAAIDTTVRGSMSGSFESALVYMMTILQFFPEKVVEFAPGIICTIDDFDCSIYFDKRRWELVNPEVWDQEKIDFGSFNAVKERVGLIEGEKFDSFEEAFAVAKEELMSDTEFFAERKPRQDIIVSVNAGHKNVARNMPNYLAALTTEPNNSLLS